MATAKAVLDEADLTYVRANFSPLADASAEAGWEGDEARELIRAGRLPETSYVLDDGTEMVPPDYFELVASAGGVDALPAHFRARWVAAAAERGVEPSNEELEEEWAGYLSGDYGVCLNRVTPEEMFRKTWLIAEIERLIGSPRPDEATWREELAQRVDELDACERPFASYDRVRFGGPVSRDRLITAVRERYLAAEAG